jgi:uncharacterized protein (DUF433 family)
LSNTLDLHILDAREAPRYGFSEVAQYLGVPVSTVRAWTIGQDYRSRRDGRKVFRPVIELPDPEEKLLSFSNLVEVHLLDAIRRGYRVPLPRVRTGLEYLREKFSSPHPLLDHELTTNSRDLFIREWGQLINISQAGQVAIREFLDAYLERIDRDDVGIPIRLYPFTRKRDLREPRHISIDPTVAFGRPVLAGTNIAATVIVERYKSGESILELADDYGREAGEIEEAIRLIVPPLAA